MPRKTKTTRPENSWKLYVVECRGGSFYTGVTTDITRRIRQHNGELAGGAQYTRAHRPVKLRALWNYSSQSTACKAETRFKRLSHAQKMIMCDNPEAWTYGRET